MSPDSSALFPSRTLPEALPLDSAKGSSTLWTPVRAIQLSAFSRYARVLIGGTQGALPLDPAKGSSTLWTPVRAIQLSAFSRYARVLIGGTQGALPLDSLSRDCVGDALMLCPRADPVSKRAAPACRDSPSNRQHSFQQEHLLELRMPADFSVPSFPARWHRGGAYIPPASPA